MQDFEGSVAAFCSLAESVLDDFGTTPSAAAHWAVCRC